MLEDIKKTVKISRTKQINIVRSYMNNYSFNGSGNDSSMSRSLFWMFGSVAPGKQCEAGGEFVVSCLENAECPRFSLDMIQQTSTVFSMFST